MEKYSVFLGDVALDEYYQAEYYPALREKVGVDMLPPQMGGMIANAACVYAAYGNPTRFLSVLNRHDRYLCDNLNKAGIDTGMVVFDDAIADSKCIILLAEGEHTVLIVNRPIEVLELPPETQQSLCGAGVIYSNYCELRPLRCGALDACGVLQAWKDAGVRLVCDIDVGELGQEAWKFFPYTHTLFMNEIGFENLRAERSAQETVDAILDAGVEILVVTLAEKGCLIHQKSGVTTIPGIPVEVVDVTGAGDTFCSSFTHLHSLCGNVELAGVFASHAAALSITSLGARSGAVGYGPVLKFMREKGVDTTPYVEMMGEDAQ